MPSLFVLGGVTALLTKALFEKRHSAMQFDKTGLDDYLTDETLESEVGIWLKFPGGRRFRVLRAGGSNKKFLRALNSAIRPHKRAMDRGTMDMETSDEIMRTIYAKHVVVDWDGIKDAQGKKVPCTPENVAEFFKAFPNLFSDVTTLATDMAQFSEERIQEAKETLGEA